jgi:hypothetical protein
MGRGPFIHRSEPGHDERRIIASLAGNTRVDLITHPERTDLSLVRGMRGDADTGPGPR